MLDTYIFTSRPYYSECLMGMSWSEPQNCESVCVFAVHRICMFFTEYTWSVHTKQQYIHLGYGVIVVHMY